MTQLGPPTNNSTAQDPLQLKLSVILVAVSLKVNLDYKEVILSASRSPQQTGVNLILHSSQDVFSQMILLVRFANNGFHALQHQHLLLKTLLIQPGIK